MSLEKDYSNSFKSDIAMAKLIEQLVTSWDEKLETVRTEIKLLKNHDVDYLLLALDDVDASVKEELYAIIAKLAVRSSDKLKYYKNNE